MSARRVVTAAAAVAVAAGLAGCSAGRPDAVAAVGFTTTGYTAVVLNCDQQRTFTLAEIQTVDGDVALSWIGRTVEPVTIFRLSQDPPDNWIERVDDGLSTGHEYTFTTSSDDGPDVVGPTFTLADLGSIDDGQVMIADGTVLGWEDFLNAGCDQ